MRSSDTVRKNLLLFAAVLEICTGVSLMVVPVLVCDLLLGAPLAGAGLAVGRCFGIALIALGVACWTGTEHAKSGSAAARAMLIYNALIALYLSYLGVIGHVSGLLLWPAAALHAAVAVALVVTSARATRHVM